MILCRVEIGDEISFLLNWTEKYLIEEVHLVPAQYFPSHYFTSSNPPCMINKHFIYLNLALNIAGSVGVTAAIPRKFPPVILYKPIDGPAVSDEKLFAVSSPATKSVDSNTNPPVRKQIIATSVLVVIQKAEKSLNKSAVKIIFTCSLSPSWSRQHSRHPRIWRQRSRCTDSVRQGNRLSGSVTIELQTQTNIKLSSINKIIKTI